MKKSLKTIMTAALVAVLTFSTIPQIVANRPSTEITYGVNNQDPDPEFLDPERKLG